MLCTFERAYICETTVTPCKNKNCAGTGEKTRALEPKSGRYDSVYLKASTISFRNSMGEERTIMHSDQPGGIHCCTKCSKPVKGMTMERRTEANSMQVEINIKSDIPQILTREVIIILRIEEGYRTPELYDKLNSWDLWISETANTQQRQGKNFTTYCHTSEYQLEKNHMMIRVSCDYKADSEESFVQSIQMKVIISKRLCAVTTLIGMKLVGSQVRQRKRRSVNRRVKRQAVVASSVAFIGGGLFNYFVNKRHGGRSEQQTKEIDLLRESKLDFEQDVLKEEKKILFKLKSNEQLIRSINSAICTIGQIQLE